MFNGFKRKQHLVVYVWNRKSSRGSRVRLWVCASPCVQHTCQKLSSSLQIKIIYVPISSHFTCPLSQHVCACMGHTRFCAILWRSVGIACTGGVTVWILLLLDIITRACQLKDHFDNLYTQGVAAAAPVFTACHGQQMLKESSSANGTNWCMLDWWVLPKQVQAIKKLCAYNLICYFSKSAA